MHSWKSASPTGAASPITTDAPTGTDATAEYPPPPWRLDGPAVVSMALIDVDRARAVVPDDLEIVEVLPGRTLGAIAVADYQHRATFPYGELAVMPAVVRYGKVSGAWISHIWVDSERSLRGGREMWGMYKHLAAFSWSAGQRNTVSVSAGDTQLVSLSWRPPQRLLPAPGFVLGIGSVNGDRRRFTARGLSWMAPATTSITIPHDSPFAGLGFADARRFSVAGRMSLLFGDLKILG
jgi:acetoacetate decarboxylase